MGIALDNAIDARQAYARLPDRSLAEKFAVTGIIQKHKKLLLVIRLTNPLPAPLRYENGEIVSTKAESGHGMGLSALRRIAQKYDGKITVSDAEGVFLLTVTLFM
jgi:sensor histidine kinase regulating citrate/malate metabolism